MSSESAFTPLRSPRPRAAWVFEDEGLRWLEREVLPVWLPTRRWFGGKARKIERVSIEAAVPLRMAQRVFVVLVEYRSGAPERYAVPLSSLPASEGLLALDEDGEAVLHDAVFDPGFRLALFEAMRLGGDGNVLGESSEGLRAEGPIMDSRVLAVEQSNTSIIYGERLFLKLFRRLQAGVNPDAEVSRYLGTRGFAHTPPFGGAVELRIGGETMPLGLMLGCVENDGDAWAWAMREVRTHFETGVPVPLERIALLGQRTAELHLALAAGEGVDFAPEPLTSEDFSQLAESVRSRADATFAALRTRVGDELSVAALAREDVVRAMIDALAHTPPGAMKTRHHGDYHLGQVLSSGGNWMIIDFEGEPSRPLAERRAKRSPLRDVAGMLRSFHYAAHAARPETEPVDAAEAWCAAACRAFLDRYLALAADACFLPKATTDRDALLAAFVLEKVLYEIDYELNNRPDWLAIPLRGFLAVTAAAARR